MSRVIAVSRPLRGDYNGGSLGWAAKDAIVSMVVGHSGLQIVTVSPRHSENQSRNRKSENNPATDIEQTNRGSLVRSQVGLGSVWV